ncbi:MAG: NnrU family protein [Candidatus Binatia bacterium]
MSPEAQVLFWWLAFAGSHTALSHPPVRSALVRRLGEGPFQGLYSVIALATFVPLVWTFFAHRAARGVPLPMLAQIPGVRWVTMLLMLVAVLLVVLGFSRPNPISPLTGRSSGAAGVLRITRHPAFMGVAVFGLAHLLVNHTALDRVFFGGMLAYALLGSAHQDWRKRQTADEPMRRYFAETSFFPFVAVATGRNRFAPRELSSTAVVAALLLYALLFTLHHRLFG